MNNEEKILGKIKSVSFGLGGYQDSQFGISITLEGGGLGVSDFRGYWDANHIKCTENCKWTEEDRGKAFEETMRFISDLINQAHVSDVYRLKDVPVEFSFSGNALKEWRILGEVL